MSAFDVHVFEVRSVSAMTKMSTVADHRSFHSFIMWTSYKHGLLVLPFIAHYTRKESLHRL